MHWPIHDSWWQIPWAYQFKHMLKIFEMTKDLKEFHPTFIKALTRDEIANSKEIFYLVEEG